MRFVVLLFLIGGSSLAAQDHQRIGASQPSVHRWSASVDFLAQPLGYQRSLVSAGTRAGYEFQRSWSASVTQPWTWLLDDAGVRGTGGPATLELGWVDPAPDLRWHASTSVAVPWEQKLRGPVRWYSFETGAHLLRDPAIVGVSLSASVPERGGGVSGLGGLSFQEVVNEYLTWSFTVTPGFEVNRQGTSLSLGLAWKVGWYEGPFSGSTGVSSGSGLPWGWTSSAGWTWEGP